MLNISEPDRFPVKRYRPKSMQFKRIIGMFTARNKPSKIRW